MTKFYSNLLIATSQNDKKYDLEASDGVSSYALDVHIKDILRNQHSKKLGPITKLCLA